jgi:hypothetical protein
VPVVRLTGYARSNFDGVWNQGQQALPFPFLFNLVPGLAGRLKIATPAVMLSVASTVKTGFLNAVATTTVNTAGNRMVCFEG